MASELPTLVLLHGAGANAAIWDPLFPLLGAFDVVAPSLPGRGTSALPALDRASGVAAWLDSHLDELGRDRVIVLGHSYGGAVAIELALCSRRPAGLVLVASGAKLRVHPTILQAALEATRGGARLSGAFAFQTGTPREVIERYEAAVSTTPPEATLADWRACDAFDRLEAIARITIPVLVVAGALDPLTRADHQRALAARVPHGELALIEGAGHMLAWESPELLVGAIEAWWKRCSAQGLAR